MTVKDSGSNADTERERGREQALSAECWAKKEPDDMGLKPLCMQIGCQQRETRSHLLRANPSHTQLNNYALVCVCARGKAIEKTKFAQYTEKDVQTRQTVANCGSTK